MSPAPVLEERSSTPPKIGGNVKNLSPIDDVDVCVIGSGASGAVAAHELARSGKRVLVLEEGNRLSPGESLETVDRTSGNSFVLTPLNRLVPEGRPWSARALGGGMSIYAGISFRYRAVDFDPRNHVAADSLDPAWPIRYEDLRPYYDEVERLFGVARRAGADPMEPESGPAPMPAHRPSTPGRLLADAGRALGMRPFPTPLAVNSVPYQGRPGCHRCGPCNEHVCPTGARADAGALLRDRPDVPADHLVVATGSRAIRIHLDSGSRAGSVEWLDLASRTRRLTRATCFVLAANAVQSSALLLRSSQRLAPRGIGNGSDMVGRGLSFKFSGYVSGSVPFRGGGPPPVTAGPHSTVSFSDHYLDVEAPTGLGGMLYEASPEVRGVRDGRIELRLHFLGADQPMYENVVGLSPRTDAYGTPRIVMEYTTHRLDEMRRAYLARRAANVLHEAGARDLVHEESNFRLGSRHLHGGCRAGTDPDESVVDPWGRVHDMDNVYVADGGFFPYAGGVNPTLTIQANALRIARRIARHLGTGPVSTTAPARDRAAS
ncbi:FAD-dependent oxidoreductase [Kitasatospora sp. NPDC006697]|uniref:FAD-dependent oxidoreductase n=1 Tax=Kitasatospora sp. NPDC006697 TaxID=3364020 RepID=UPI003691943F